MNWGAGGIVLIDIDDTRPSSTYRSRHRIPRSLVRSVTVHASSPPGYQTVPTGKIDALLVKVEGVVSEIIIRCLALAPVREAILHDLTCDEVDTSTLWRCRADRQTLVVDGQGSPVTQPVWERLEGERLFKASFAIPSAEEQIAAYRDWKVF
jgi:hypothetical protein